MGTFFLLDPDTEILQKHFYFVDVPCNKICLIQGLVSKLIRLVMYSTMNQVFVKVVLHEQLYT